MKLKKVILIIILLLVIAGLVLILTANSRTKTIEKESDESNTTKVEQIGDDEVDIVIKDNVFIEQTNDIYYNPEDYLGKTIKIEGFPMSYNGLKFVGRYGPRMLCRRWICISRIYVSRRNEFSR